MDGEAGRMVRGVTVERHRGLLRVSGAILALSLSVAALTAAWAMTTRTTSATTQGWPFVYRENLITGHAEFCGLDQNRAATCRPVGVADWSSAGRIVARNDFADKATPAPAQ